MGADGGEIYGRRRFLAWLAGALGGVGAALSAWPLIRALSPTKDILAAGRLEADISGVKEGELKTIIWRKQPVFILRRTPEMIKKTAGAAPSAFADPASEADRAARPDIFVCIGICTHLGCVPKYMPDKVPGTDAPGFYCPCHGGMYDTLGRRIGGPPPENLHLVPYAIESDSRLVIGTEEFPGYGANIRTIGALPKA